MKNLTNIIYKYRNHNFSYTEGFDCAIFCAKVLEEYNNTKLPMWRDITKYNTYRGALKTIRNLGCKDLSEVPEKVLGSIRKDISKVNLGDIVYYINQDSRGVLGICNGKRSYFLCRNGGLSTRNTIDCKYCWGPS